MLSFVNCALSLRIAPLGIARHPCESGEDAGLRPRTLKHEHIEEFHFLEPVALGLEVLPPLVNGCVDQLIVIAGERDLWPVGLEDVLIDMKAFAERLEGRFKPLHSILLFIVIKAFVVHPCNAQHHPKVAALGEECRLCPEPTQVNVGAEGIGFLLRLDDAREIQHYRTSTFGTVCLAAS